MATISPAFQRRNARELARENAAAKRARLKAEADDRATSEALAEEALSILETAGFSSIAVTLKGALWSITATDPAGVERGGGRADPVALARDMILLACAARDAALALEAQARLDAAPIEDEAHNEGERVAADIEPERRVEEHYIPAELLAPPVFDVESVAAAATIEPAAGGGMMIERDEVARRRLLLSTQIDERAGLLIAARIPSEGVAIERISALNNALILGVISVSERDELSALNAENGWARRMLETAANVKRALSEATLQAMDTFDLDVIPWPEPPGEGAPHEL